MYYIRCKRTRAKISNKVALSICNTLQHSIQHCVDLLLYKRHSADRLERREEKIPIHRYNQINGMDAVIDVATYSSQNAQICRRISDIAFNRKWYTNTHTHTHHSLCRYKLYYTRLHQYLHMLIGGFAVAVAVAVNVSLFILFVLFYHMQTLNVPRIDARIHRINSSLV